MCIALCTTLPNQRVACLFLRFSVKTLPGKEMHFPMASGLKAEARVSNPRQGHTGNTPCHCLPQRDSPPRSYADAVRRRPYPPPQRNSRGAIRPQRNHTAPRVVVSVDGHGSHPHPTLFTKSSARSRSEDTQSIKQVCRRSGKATCSTPPRHSAMRVYSSN